MNLQKLGKDLFGLTSMPDTRVRLREIEVPAGTDEIKISRLILRAVSRAALDGLLLVNIHEDGDSADRAVTYSLTFVADLAPAWWRRLRITYGEWRETRREAAAAERERCHEINY